MLHTIERFEDLEPKLQKAMLALHKGRKRLDFHLWKPLNDLDLVDVDREHDFLTEKGKQWIAASVGSAEGE